MKVYQSASTSAIWHSLSLSNHQSIPVSSTINSHLWKLLSINHQTRLYHNAFLNCFAGYDGFYCHSIICGRGRLCSFIICQHVRLLDSMYPRKLLLVTVTNKLQGNDPTNGYVNYIDQSAAESSGLYKVNGDKVYMGVDSTNVASGRGRDSIRISSKKSYNHGLIILDLEHMPGGACGTWPAFWLLGPNWPNSGEVDIIEGVNMDTTNAMTLHTSSGCSITSTGNFAGQMKTSNCDVNAAGQDNNAGCSITTPNTESFGSGFNNANGGVYATQWTSSVISIWFFPRAAIPSDISSGNPNPENWGLPTASFSGGCDMDEHIVNQQIVFDITFCGDWAGGVWSTESSCSAKANTCQDYVQNNPSAFQDSYWSINSLKVYQDNGSAASAVSSSAAEPTAAATTAAPAPIETTTQASPAPESTSTSAPEVTSAAASVPATTEAASTPAPAPTPEPAAATTNAAAPAATSTANSDGNSGSWSRPNSDSGSSNWGSWNGNNNRGGNRGGRGARRL